MKHATSAEKFIEIENVWRRRLVFQMSLFNLFSSLLQKSIYHTGTIIETCTIQKLTIAVHKKSA